MYRLLAVFLISLVFFNHAQGAPYQYEKRRVVYKNLHANLYVPIGVANPPVVIGFGGSDGGMAGADPTSELLAPHGFAVLALGYFKVPGLPDTLDSIPLEYFISAVDYLHAVPGLDHRRIGVVSGSRGSEAAVLLAIHDQRIKAVAVTTPSNVSWYGRTTARSAWRLKGQDIPAMSLGLTPDAPQLERFHAALSDKAAVEKARLALEKINGPIFLISAEKDQIWPSYEMANDMVDYLKTKKSYRHTVKHISYPTGHGFSKETVPGLKASVVDFFLTALK